MADGERLPEDGERLPEGGPVPQPGDPKPEPGDVPEPQPGGATETQPAVVHVPDIPLPTAAMQIKEVVDEFEGAFRLAVIGAGQGGSRLAETFWNLGYRRVCILNTAAQDMAAIRMPEERKLLIGETGAAKDIAFAQKLAESRYEDILDFMRRGFEGGYDRILICIGAGGGTGAGTVGTLVRVAQDLNESLDVGEGKVGVLVALPTKAEGRRVNANAHATVSHLLGSDSMAMVSPLIILDNQRIKEIYPGLTVEKFWRTANQSVCSLFHLFNTIAVADSPYTSFDRADLEAVLASGIIAFGATPVDQWADATDVSYAIRDNLRRNILAGGMDLSKGSVAGCVVIGSPAVLKEIPQEHLEHGFEQLSRIMGLGSTVHRGIYQGDREGLVVYTMIGGLEAPVERLQEMAKLGNVVKMVDKPDE